MFPETWFVDLFLRPRDYFLRLKKQATPIGAALTVLLFFVLLSVSRIFFSLSPRKTDFLNLLMPFFWIFLAVASFILVSFVISRSIAGKGSLVEHSFLLGSAASNHFVMAFIAVIIALLSTGATMGGNFLDIMFITFFLPLFLLPVLFHGTFSGVYALDAAHDYGRVKAFSCLALSTILFLSFFLYSFIQLVP